MKLHVMLLPLFGLAQIGASELPDIRSIPADLAVPPLVAGPPAAGLRVRHRLAGDEDGERYVVLYLPPEWADGGSRGDRLPVLVEFPGNGPYQNAFGDACSGLPEGGKLGFGLSGGKGCIWVCLPFLDGAGTGIARQWWGDAPSYDPEPTLAYCRQAVGEICRDFGGDEGRVVLCGFSRGAIACNFLGLHDDETARMWRGFFVYSHYDGLRSWPFPGSDRVSAANRLARLGDRPQFICSEGSGAAETESFLAGKVPAADLTFSGTGFRNHNDEWILRPCEARDRARAWLARVVGDKAASNAISAPAGIRPDRPGRGEN